MARLSRSSSLLACLVLIFSALPIAAQTTQIQHGVPWRDANAPSGFAPTAAHLSYFGGPVVSNAHVVQVLYGSGSYNPQVAGVSSPTMGNFFGDLLGISSGYITLLGQYSTNISGGTNQIIGNGRFDGIFQITPSSGNNGSTINDSNIQAELLAQINAGHLPAPVLDAAGNVNTIYMIYFPPGKTIINSQGSTSCVSGGFCAYHGTTSSTLNSRHLLYGVMPDMQAGSGCSTGCGASSVFGNYTSVTSHELSETITDADVGIATTFAAPLAWYDPSNGEIGDICNQQQGSYTANGTTYTIQLEFSNAAGNCVLPPAATPRQAVNFTVGREPSNLAFDGSSIWVANSHTANVTKLRASDGATLGTFSLGINPRSVAFDGTNVWVTTTGTSLIKLRPSDGAQLGTFNMPVSVGSIAFDGANLWLVSNPSSVVVKVSAASGAVLGTFPVGTGPAGACFDGANIWVANWGAGTVTKLRASDGALLGTFAAGSGPEDLAFDGANIWATDFNGNTVTKLRASDGATLGTFAVGTNPVGIVFDGTSVWVANWNGGGSGTVTELRSSDGRLLGTFNVDRGPLGMAFDGSYVWTANGGLSSNDNNTVSKL